MIQCALDSELFNECLDYEKSSKNAFIALNFKKRFKNPKISLFLRFFDFMPRFRFKMAKIPESLILVAFFIKLWHSLRLQKYFNCPTSASVMDIPGLCSPVLKFQTPSFRLETRYCATFLYFFPSCSLSIYLSVLVVFYCVLYY